MDTGQTGEAGDLAAELVVEVQSQGRVIATQHGMEERPVEDLAMKTQDAIQNPVRVAGQDQVTFFNFILRKVSLYNKEQGIKTEKTSFFYVMLYLSKIIEQYFHCCMT